MSETTIRYPKPIAFARVSTISGAVRGIFEADSGGNAPDVELKSERMVAMIPLQAEPAPHGAIDLLSEFSEAMSDSGDWPDTYDERARLKSLVDRVRFYLEPAEQWATVPKGGEEWSTVPKGYTAPAPAVPSVPTQQATDEPVGEAVEIVAAGWLEAPYGEFRRNPAFHVSAPLTVGWSIPLYASAFANTEPAVPEDVARVNKQMLEVLRIVRDTLPHINGNASSVNSLLKLTGAAIDAARAAEKGGE